MRRPDHETLRAYYGQARGIAAKLLGAADPNCDDLAQEIMISFLRGIKIFRHDADIDTLFYIVSKRRGYDHLRKKYSGERRIVELALYKVDTLLGGNKHMAPRKKRTLTLYRRLLQRRQIELCGYAEKKKNGGKK